MLFTDFSAAAVLMRQCATGWPNYHHGGPARQSERRYCQVLAVSDGPESSDPSHVQLPAWTGQD